MRQAAEGQEGERWRYVDLAALREGYIVVRWKTGEVMKINSR